MCLNGRASYRLIMAFLGLGCNFVLGDFSAEIGNLGSVEEWYFDYKFGIDIGERDSRRVEADGIELEELSIPPY